jgi:phosphatidylglycerol:prolipoprotein diacylglycerol transferase
MLPVLFSIGSIEIRSYGLFMALALIVGSFVVWKKAKDEAYDEEKIFDGLVFTIIFGLIGARVYCVFLNFSRFGFDPLKWIWVTRYAGLCFHGGLLGGILGLYLFARREKWNFWQTADTAVFGLALGQVIARIGCFFDGCCFGQPTDVFWGVMFSGFEERRHPTQIYEAFLGLLIFYFLNKLERRYRLFDWYKGKKDRAEPGFLFLFYLIAYSFGRIILETWRGDSVYWLGIKSAQITSAFILLISLFGLYRRSGSDWQFNGKLLSERAISVLKGLEFREKTRIKRREKKRHVKVGDDIR